MNSSVVPSSTSTSTSSSSSSSSRRPPVLRRDESDASNASEKLDTLGTMQSMNSNSKPKSKPQHARPMMPRLLASSRHVGIGLSNNDSSTTRFPCQDDKEKEDDDNETNNLKTKNNNMNAPLPPPARPTMEGATTTTTTTTTRLLASSRKINSNLNNTQETDNDEDDTTANNDLVDDEMDMENGLLIYFNTTTSKSTSSTNTTTTTTTTPSTRCDITFNIDHNYKNIHPNMYAPKTLQNVTKLGGGGSGVSVFSGKHPQLGSLVMKHGGYKDMIELFALATIAHELKVRSTTTNGNSNTSNNSNNEQKLTAAAHDMQTRIPEFKMIYMSPYHFRSRGKEFFQSMKSIIHNWSLFTTPSDVGGQGGGDGGMLGRSFRRKSSMISAGSNRRSSSGNNMILQQMKLMEQLNLSYNKLSSTSSREVSLSSLPEEEEHSHEEQQQEEKKLSSSTVSFQLPSREASFEKTNTNNGNNGHSSTSKRMMPMVRPSMIIQQMNPNLSLNFGKSIRLYSGIDDEFSFQLDRNCESVALVFPKDSCEFLNNNNDGTGRTTTVVRLRGDPYFALNEIVEEFIPFMTDQLFKFTLGQKTIGGDDSSTNPPQTGNQLLYNGELHGPTLEILITQMIQIIHNLQLLTLPEEVDVIELVRAEVAQFDDDDDDNDGKESGDTTKQDNLKDDTADDDDYDDSEYKMDASDVSELVDNFVGNAIRKNFHPVKGRQRLLQVVGEMFRNHPDNLILTPEEELPAMYLGVVLKRGALMGDTFDNVPQEPTTLHPEEYFWKNILKHAVEDRPGQSLASLQRIWTCGLADAGIHNLFVSSDKVWLFDLGEPQLQSLPGFLTKFLFSFFHTLGMQEPDEDDEEHNPNHDWVRRFIPSPTHKNKLALTKETVDLLPKAYHAFEVCLDRIIEEIFDGDDNLRWLLIQYVTLQLLSDTAFCIQRWQIKGGGQKRESNHNKGIEKWLWRALWDVYVAYDINTKRSWSRFLVQKPPSFSSSSDNYDDRQKES